MIAALCNAGILLWMLRARLSGIEGGRLLVALSKIALASAVMAVAAHETERWLHVPFPGDGTAPQAIRVFGAIATGLAVLAAAAWTLRVREFTESLRAILR